MYWCELQSGHWFGNPKVVTPGPSGAPAGFDGSTPLFLYGGIQTAGESNVFALDAPEGYGGPATVRLQTAGVSLLDPRLTVFDATGKHPRRIPLEPDLIKSLY